MGEPQRSAPLLRVDQQRQMQRKPRLTGIEVAHFVRIGVAKLAVRRVVDREGQPRAACSLRRPQRVCVEEALE
jgi:hypothetical protein